MTTRSLLPLQGLPPGIHRFKYLVDGCWVIDLAGHTEADARGNINNIVMVTPQGKPLLRSRSAAASSSDDSGSEDEDGSCSAVPAGSQAVGFLQPGREGAAAAAQPAVLATAEPPTAAAAVAAADGEQAPPEQPRVPWVDDEEMEAMARFGAAVLAFHTRLGVQLRHKLH